MGFYKDDKYGWSMDAKTRKLYQRRLDYQLSVVATYELLEWEEGAAPLASFTWRGNDLWFTRTGKPYIYRRSKQQLRGGKVMINMRTLGVGRWWLDFLGSRGLSM